MPVFSITVVNQTFESQNEHDVATIEDARSEAIRSALQIGIDELSLDNPLFAAEVKIARDGEHLMRYVISMGVSQLR